MKYPIGIISSEGDIRFWRELGKEVTIYTSFHSDFLHIDKKRVFKGKIYIDKRHVYLCWGEYTARFTTILDEPVKIKLCNNVFLENDFCLTDEQYNGKCGGYFQIIIDDVSNKVYLMFKEKQQNNKAVYTDCVSNISYITNRQMTLSPSTGTINPNTTHFACIVKNGIPSFANTRNNEDHRILNNIDTFKQRNCVFFINTTTNKISVIDIRNSKVLRLSDARLGYIFFNKNKPIGYIQYGDRYRIYIESNYNDSYSVEGKESTTNKGTFIFDNSLPKHKIKWDDFDTGDDIFE